MTHSKVMDDIGERLNGLESRARFRVGVITDDDPLSVELGSSGVSHTSVAALCRPRVGDIVAVLMFGNDLLVTSVLALPTWTNFSMQNAWVVHAGGYYTPGYQRDGLGYVHLRGAIKNGVMGTAACTLPVGFRPGSSVAFATAASNGAGGIDIGSNGAIVPYGGGGTGYVGLDGVIFRAEV